MLSRSFLPYKYLNIYYESALLHNSMNIIFLYNIYITIGFKFCNLVYVKWILSPFKGKHFCYFNYDGMIIFIPIFIIIIAIKYV